MVDEIAVGEIVGMEFFFAAVTFSNDAVPVYYKILVARVLD
jgi:hypothetical protein